MLMLGRLDQTEEEEIEHNERIKTLEMILKEKEEEVCLHYTDINIYYFMLIARWMKINECE